MKCTLKRDACPTLNSVRREVLSDPAAHDTNATRGRTEPVASTPTSLPLASPRTAARRCSAAASPGTLCAAGPGDVAPRRAKDDQWNTTRESPRRR